MKHNTICIWDIQDRGPGARPALYHECHNGKFWGIIVCNICHSRMPKRLEAAFYLAKFTEGLL